MSKTISAICIKCKTTYHLGTRVCHRCQKPLNDFKARIKTSSGWRTKQTKDLAEAQAFLNRAPAPSPLPTSQPRAAIATRTSTRQLM